MLVIAHMTQAGIPLEKGKDVLIEDLRHQAKVFVATDDTVILNCQSCADLTPVLQGVEAKVGGVN